MRGRRGFSTLDTLIAGTLVAGTLGAVLWILLNAENVKRETAARIVQLIADANHKRVKQGKAFVIGRVDEASRLVADGDVDRLEWASMPYSFAAAESVGDPCIVASAKRRSDGPRGTGRATYASWGVCADKLGAVERFDSACTLDCRKPVEVAAPPPVEERPFVPTKSSFSKPNKVDVDMPDIGVSEKPKVVKYGCSVKGCLGAACCDPETDKCVSCPGSACCEKELGCGGTCYSDDDCLQGCSCKKLPGSSSGNCKG